MPDVSTYLAEFGLLEGLQIAGYVLEKIQISHNEVSRFREYAYPTVLTWKKLEASANFSSFQYSFQNQVKSPRITYTKYGNPYDCLFGKSEFKDQGNQIVVTANGNCKRNFELPKH